MMTTSRSTQDESFPCLMVRRLTEKGEAGDAHKDGESISCAVEMLTVDDLPEGEVLIEVQWSSLNYKDALACQAHPGVVRKLPHVPGIDCAGTILASTVPEYQAGQQVLVTGYDLGSGRWGGWSARVRVPAEWVVALPAGLTPETAMLLGTAGFTAAQSVMALQRNGVVPASGKVIVTGATGGVGSLAVAILTKLGYHVVAVTGKPAQGKLLQQLGASQILTREEVDDASHKPLLPARWAGAVDTVGGNALATLLRSMQHRGCVTACGLVAGDQLPLTVYPFILRGVTLAGIDSAKCPRESREHIWQQLADAWKPDGLQQLAQKITLQEAPAKVRAMLAGETCGRTLVEPVIR
jgi:acrylyl-CoA reductase (NADPH)